MDAWLSRVWRQGVQALKGTNADEALHELSDFTTTQRVMPLSAMAIVIGVLNAFVALALLKLIGLFTSTLAIFE